VKLRVEIPLSGSSIRSDFNGFEALPIEKKASPAPRRLTKYRGEQVEKKSYYSEYLLKCICNLP